MTGKPFARELVSKCFVLVESTHKGIGFDRLPARICQKDNMVALAFVPGADNIMRGAHGGFVLRIYCWLAGLGVLIAAWALSWWVLLGLVGVFVVDRRLAASDRRAWMLLAAMLLSLEILAHDFAGWGTACPNERQEALSFLGQQSENLKTTWLDYYLPRRGEISDSILKETWGVPQATGHSKETSE